MIRVYWLIVANIYLQISLHDCSEQIISDLHCLLGRSEDRFLSESFLPVMQLIFLEFLLVSSLFSHANSFWHHSPASDPDEHRDLEALIVSRGYTSTIHPVITRDGYILNLYRIANPRRKNIGPSKPVVLQHGLLGAGTDWVLGSAQAGLPEDLIEKIEKGNVTIPKGMGNNLGYVLSDLGYDVWLSNSRGNKYSRDHVALNPDEGESLRTEVRCDQWTAFRARLLQGLVLTTPRL